MCSCCHACVPRYVGSPLRHTIDHRSLLTAQPAASGQRPAHRLLPHYGFSSFAASASRLYGKARNPSTRLAMQGGARPVSQASVTHLGSGEVLRCVPVPQGPTNRARSFSTSPRWSDQIAALNA
jgi:hypothetical protein